MTRDEVAALLAYAARLDPRGARRDPAEARDQLAQWADLLAEVPATAPGGWDAAAIARRHITTSPYPLLPVDITRAWHAHRRDLLDRHTDPRPDVDPDSVAAYRAQLAAHRRAVATGQAAPTSHRQITPPPRSGDYIPDHVRALLAPYRPSRAARDQALAEGRPDPYAVACPHCQARPGDPCRSRRTRPDGAQPWRRRTSPHPSRIEAAEQGAAA